MFNEKPCVYSPTRVDTCEIGQFQNLTTIPAINGRFYVVKYGSDSDNNLYLHPDGLWYRYAGMLGSWATREEAQAALDLVK